MLAANFDAESVPVPVPVPVPECDTERCRDDRCPDGPAYICIFAFALTLTLPVGRERCGLKNVFAERVLLGRLAFESRFFSLRPKKPPEECDREWECVCDCDWEKLKSDCEREW